MNEAATIRTAGRVADKFKMRLVNGTLTVISETFNRNGNNNRARWETTLETFSLANPDKPEALGELRLAKGERLFATRFDADRVYIVTYERIDPLWIRRPVRPTRANQGGRTRGAGLVDLHSSRWAIGWFRSAWMTRTTTSAGWPCRCST